MSKFVTKKWIKANDLSSGQYSIKKNIKFKASMLRSDLCEYSDAYIVVEGRIIVEGNMLKQEIRSSSSKIMLHLDHAYQKSITQL